MKIKNIKQERGITLIALVITIIVLLILAGVAISMLSGENGILTRTSEAKERTEEAQKEEETNLASMELETYFIINNLKYKCAYGYVTGIDIGEKITQLQEALQAGGYELKAKDGTDNFTAKNDEGDFIVTTGLLIEKDNKTIAKTVIFGDVDKNGNVTVVDAGDITGVFAASSYEQYDLSAMDIDGDGEITFIDANLIIEFEKSNYTINQFRYAKEPVLYTNEQLNEQENENFKEKIEKLQGKKFTIEWSQEENLYLLKGATSDTKVSEILEVLKEVAKEGEEITIGNNKTGESNIECNDIIKFSYKYYDNREIQIGEDIYVDF